MEVRLLSSAPPFDVVQDFKGLVVRNIDWVEDDGELVEIIYGELVEPSSRSHHFMKIGYDYPGVTIVYFCHDGKGNFVMAKRSKNTRDEHGRWDIGAGELEYGETVETTLRREITEEYNTDVLNFEFLGFRELHHKHKGKNTHWIGLDFKCLIDPRKVKNGEPHKFDEVSWFTLKKLPSNIHSQLPFFLEKYRPNL